MSGVGRRARLIDIAAEKPRRKGREGERERERKRDRKSHGEGCGGCARAYGAYQKVDRGDGIKVVGPLQERCSCDVCDVSEIAGPGACWSAAAIEHLANALFHSENWTFQAASMYAG